MIALTAKRNEGRYTFRADSKYPEQFIQAKDKCRLFSHKIKKLDIEHLQQRKEKREELSTNSKTFSRYKARLHLTINTPEQATIEEKIKILRYFVVLNTKLPTIQKTILHIIYIILTRKPLDTNKLEPRKEATFFSQATCGSASALFLQLANEFLEVSGEIHSIAGHHSYVILYTNKKQYFADFSERLILLKYKPYTS